VTYVSRVYIYILYVKFLKLDIPHKIYPKNRIRKIFKSTSFYKRSKIGKKKMNKGRKITGGKYHSLRKRKLFEKNRQARIVRLGKDKRKSIRTRGGNIKTIVLSAEIANIYNKKTHKSKKAKITNVLETPSNKFLARQNILVKGAIIETDAGRARVTNRPSQEGNVQAILIE